MLNFKGKAVRAGGVAAFVVSSLVWSVVLWRTHRLAAPEKGGRWDGNS